MDSELEYWNKYWSDKRQPAHRCHSREHYDKYSQELKVLFRKGGYNNVLELGCGTGDFYERLGFKDAAYYKGIDLSESMLEEFRKTHPDAVLQKASAHDYSDDQKYDLIYSNGVMQNLDGGMLRGHFLNAEKMLSEGGEIIDASLPWAAHRNAYRMRKLTPPYNPLSKKAVKSAIALLVNMAGIRRDSMGHWHTPNQISKIAAEFGLQGEYYGSMYYPYRFHVVLRRA